MRPCIGVVSITWASMVFHTAPNAAEPSVVIRLMERDGTSDGGIMGAGGGGAGTLCECGGRRYRRNGRERRACKKAANDVEHRMSSLGACPSIRRISLYTEG